MLVLLGGGNSSGKATYSETIRDSLSKAIPSLKIREIDLEKHYYNYNHNSVETNTTLPLRAENYEFERLLKDIDACEEDVVIVHGIYVLYNKALRMKASLKIFIDCDNDTRLSRFIAKNSPVSKARLADLIATHLATRSDLVGRVESDIVIKTDAIDDKKNALSIGLIINYLIDLLNTDSDLKLDKGEINLSEIVERFYELN